MTTEKTVEVPKFEMLALGKVEVGGVEYAAGDVFVVQGADRVRWLIANGSAKPYSLTEGEAGVASAPKGTSETTTMSTGTQHAESKDSGQAGTAKPRKRR